VSGVVGVALAALWASVVLYGFASWRPAPAAVRALAPGPRVRARRPAVDQRAARLVPAALASVVMALLVPGLAPITGVGVWLVPVLRARRQRRQVEEMIRASVPEVVDLLSLAVGAGLTVPLAVASVGRRLTGPIGAELRRVSEEVERGQRCGDALQGAGSRLDDAARPLIDALIASDRYGAPLADALARLSVELRADRRRWAEARARRVPVQLLFPLVICVLPAFALLTVAPLLASGLRSLRL
jgi:tight adherence protein C